MGEQVRYMERYQGCSPLYGYLDEFYAAAVVSAAAFTSCASLTLTRIRIPSQPRRSGFVLSTYWSMPPC